MPNAPGKRHSSVISPFKSYRMILKEELKLASYELERPWLSLLTSAMMAGFSIGVSVLGMATIFTMFGADLSAPYLELIAANLFAIGFVVVIIGRMDLFTEYAAFATLPVWAGQASFFSVLRLWGIVLIGNLLGGFVFSAALVHLTGHLDSLAVPTLIKLSHKMTDVPAAGIFVSAAIAGWLIGLMGWLVTAVRHSTAQIISVWALAMAIGLPPLHHVITGSIEVFAAAILSDTIGFQDCLRFTSLAALGNISGGLFFSAMVSAHLHGRESQAKEQALEESRI